jgi:hypothetical protein
MDFLKRLFARKERTYDPAQWTTLFPAEAVERNLLANNKEWVFISVDKVAKARRSGPLQGHALPAQRRRC